MNPTDYLKNVLLTNNNDYESVKNRIDNRAIDLLHAGYGWASEMSELVDAVHNKDLDFVNISEEIGDQLWYLSIGIKGLGLDPEKISSHEQKAKEAGLRVKDRDDLKTALLALVWASGEFDDLVKKHLFYGRNLDMQKAEEFLSSMALSLSGMAFICGTTLEQCRETNIAKLKLRYADKFTEDAALNRDLVAERKILEEGLK